ncbi:MAG: site-specific integrase [Myxococcales bacterium]|nr:site-specific integrase [Myxococcales bacterium]
MSKSRYPGIERLSSGRYRVRVTWIDPKTSKKKDQKQVIAAANMAEANSKRELLRAELLSSGATPRQRLRLGEYASSWMRGKIPTLKPSTRDKYAGMLDRHILPALGDFYVDAISPQDVILWRDAQHAKASTVNSRLRVLRALLRDAQADLGLPRDPCARVRTLPENPPVGNRLKPEDLQRVLAYLREHEPDWYPLFLTMALTGARFGEVSALRWDDIDEDANVIWIRRSQWQGRVGTTKTGKVRDVPLPPPLKTVLKQHRQRLVRKQALGLSEGLLFPSRVGTHRRNASLRKPLERALKAAGVADRFTLHGFRRTWNNLLRQVASGAITRSMIGHETEEMFLHYSHIERDEKQSAVERALALVDGRKVEDRVEGSQPGDDARNVSRRQTTRND